MRRTVSELISFDPPLGNKIPPELETAHAGHYAILGAAEIRLQITGAAGAAAGGAAAAAAAFQSADL